MFTLVKAEDGQRQQCQDGAERAHPKGSHAIGSPRRSYGDVGRLPAEHGGVNWVFVTV